MGSNLNFNNNEPPVDGSGRPPGPGNLPLFRQTSIYSLTFDEFQNTLGGMRKDFGSMNMDELLKSIWSAEETQSMATPSIGGGRGGGGGQEVGNTGGGYLQRQGSLTLPRTISQRKVDDVWKDLSKEFSSGKDGGDGSNNAPQRQQTLGETTLEEFLARASVVREDAQPFGKPNLGGNNVFGDLGPPSNNGDPVFGINFQQPTQGVDLMGSNRLLESNQHNINMMSSTLPLNVNGVRTSHQQPQRQQPLFPKPAVSYGIVGFGNSGMKNSLLPSSAMQGGATGVPSGSPDALEKSDGDTSSVSPVPYVNHGGFRGRKPGNADRAVERRQKRMIKNRESAARSRARKQAYTMELEEEVAKLKGENEELRKKQEEIMEMQKKQALEMNAQSGARKRLRRTQTGIW